MALGGGGGVGGILAPSSPANPNPNPTPDGLFFPHCVSLQTAPMLKKRQRGGRLGRGRRNKQRWGGGGEGKGREG